MEDNLERIGRAMMLAWQRVKKAQARMWGDWMTIGEGLMEGRRWAMQQAGTNKPEGKGYVIAFGEWLKRFRVDDMDKSDRAKLLQLMEERPAVEEWRAGLDDYERRNLNNPTIVWRKWTAATRVKKPRHPTVAYPEIRQSVVTQLQERVAELEQEAEGLRGEIDELAKGDVCAFCGGSAGPMVKGEQAAICLSCVEWVAAEAEKLERDPSADGRPRGYIVEPGIDGMGDQARHGFAVEVRLVDRSELRSRIGWAPTEEEAWALAAAHHA